MHAGDYPTMAGHCRLVQFLDTGPSSQVYLGQHILVPEMHYAIKKPATTASAQVQTLYRRASIIPLFSKDIPLRGQSQLSA
jgi:hypothetical protein